MHPSIYETMASFEGSRQKEPAAVGLHYFVCGQAPQTRASVGLGYVYQMRCLDGLNACVRTHVIVRCVQFACILCPQAMHTVHLKCLDLGARTALSRLQLRELT